MYHYIRAHYRDGSLILGNLDGQAAIKTRRPLTSSAWGKLLFGPKHPRVHYWTLSDAEDNILATKFNPHYQEPSRATS